MVVTPRYGEAGRLVCRTHRCNSVLGTRLAFASRRRGIHPVVNHSPGRQVGRMRCRQAHKRTSWGAALYR